MKWSRFHEWFFSDFSTNHFKKLKIYIILRRSILSTLNALSTTTKVHLKAKGIYFQPNMQKKRFSIWKWHVLCMTKRWILEGKIKQHFILFSIHLNIYCEFSKWKGRNRSLASYETWHLALNAFLFEKEYGKKIPFRFDEKKTNGSGNTWKWIRIDTLMRG